ncbi:MAG: hypothetical protein Q9193_006094 [Seirophora villosa]
MSSSIIDHERPEELQVSASLPSLQAQEATKNASLLNQSPSSQSLSTSPHHHREVNASSPPATITSRQQRPTSSPSAFPATTKPPSTARPSYFSLHSVSSGIEARSPATKRAPASRSSHGIATTNGPPPALITQRSYHAEPWRTSFPNDPPNPAVDPSQHSPAPESGTTLPRRNSTITKTSGAAKSDAMNGTARRHRATSVAHDLYDEEAEEDDTLRTLGGTPRSSRASRHTHNGTGPDGHDEDHSYSSHEDLFLHLARTESEAGNNFDAKTRHSKRPSDVGLTTSPSVRASRPWSTRPASSGRELAGEQPEEQMAHWSRPSRFDPSMNSRQSPQRDRAYGASAHPLDAGKRRYQRSEASSKASYITPRADLVSGLPSRSYKHSGHSHVSGNHYDSSPLMNTAPQGNHQSHRPEGTESTASTTAPSTVWDELDDLKSRIRKLELTGKLPSSSGAAINGVVNGRPRTASTTMTTASPSPRRYRVSNTSPEASTVKDIETSSLHPLLHSALTKAKSLIDPKAFKALETTATDALTLAALAGDSKSTGQENSTGGSCHNLDRQIRRKADNMCRSLTELCIALSEEQSFKERSAAGRPGTSRAVNDTQTPESPQNFRATSQEPERSSSRIMSRLEARRTSLMAAKNAATPPNNNADNTSQNESPLTHQDISTPTQPSSRIDRSSSAFFYRRRTIDANATDAATSRPASRVTTANTEQQRPSLATRLSSTTIEQRPSPGTRLPREYTSQHPLPAQRSPSVRSSLPSTTARRSYFPSNSPSTPQGNGAVLQPGSKRYLSSATTERQTPPSSSSATENSARLAQARQERIASLGQYGGSSRLRLVEGEEAEPGS